VLVERSGVDNIIVGVLTGIFARRPMVDELADDTGQAYFVTFLPPSSSASMAQPFSGLDTCKAVGA